VKFHVTGARARYIGMQWKEQDRAGAGIRETARVDQSSGWMELAYAGFSYVTTDFSPTEYRIQPFTIPVR